MAGSFILNGIEYFGNDGKNILCQEVTQAQYNALPASKLTDGIMYFITDASDGATGFPPLIYSDQEREIGVWRDGKPLYQKTIDCGALPNNTTKNINHNISNIDFIVKAEGYALAPNVNSIPIPFVNNDNSTSQICLITTTSVISLRTSVDRSAFTKSYVTLYYTKTTDTPGSGTWTTQGGYANHYSTTEHVIGTWIDGKPIYEKSYLYENSSGSQSSSEIVIVNDFGTDKQIIPGGLQGAFYSTTGANYPVPWADCNGSSGNSTGLWVGDGKIKLRIRNDTYSNSYKLRITAQYTKTTD